LEKVLNPVILDPARKILDSWEFFWGKKKGEKGNFLRFPHKFLNAKNFSKNLPMLIPTDFPKLKISPQISQCYKLPHKFPNAENFPTNFPMLKIFPLSQC